MIGDLVFVFDEDGGILRMKHRDFVSATRDGAPTERRLVTAWRNTGARAEEAACRGDQSTFEDGARISWPEAASPPIVNQNGFGVRCHAALDSMVREKARKRCVVLLLHEDARHELEVFRRYDSEKGGEDDDVCATQKKAEKKKMKRRNGDIVDVVCVLGAVRDLRRTEEEAVKRAARQLGMMDICICNLGRTAEFTSKVVMMMVLHNLNGALKPAVSSLLRKKNEDGDDSLMLKKLDPMREGGWTWDGNLRYHRDKYKKGAKAKVPGRDGCDAAPSSSMRGQLHSVIYLRHVPSSSLSTSPSSRDNLLNAVHLAVVALWRSKVNSENSSRQDSSGAFGCGGNELLPKLTLIFADNVRVTFDREMLLRFMAERHMAAPCEFQVISAMIQLAQQEEQRAGGAAGEARRRMRKACARPLIQVLHEEHRPESTKVLHVLLDGDWAVADDDFSSYIYRNDVPAPSSSGDSPMDLVLLFDAGPAWSLQEDLRHFFRSWRLDHAFAWVRVVPESLFTHDRRTAHEEDGGGDANGGDGGGSGEEDRGICTLTLRRMFPSFALVAFQNWQSHGVLMPALGRLFQSEDPGSDGDKGTSKTNPKLDKDGDGDVLAGTVRSAEVATAEQTPRKKAKHSDTTTATGTAKTQKLKIR